MHDPQIQFSSFMTERSLSYRNQSSDLLCKSMNWFLHDRNLRHERVKSRLNIDKANCKIFQLNFASSFIIAMGYIFWPKIFLYTVAYFTVKRFIIFTFVQEIIQFSRIFIWFLRCKEATFIKFSLLCKRLALYSRIIATLKLISKMRQKLDLNAVFTLYTNFVLNIKFDMA